jgi:hypothetical protein
LDGVTVMALEPLAPCAMLTLLGDAARLKSGVAAAACETVDVVEYKSLLLVELVASPLK